MNGSDSGYDFGPVKAELNELVVERETIYRVRIAHVHTLKDGWRVNETTVEATGPDIDYDDLALHMQEAYHVGEDEAKERNRMDRSLRGALGMSADDVSTVVGRRSQELEG